MADPKDKTLENEVVLGQFRRNLDHIIIGTAAGPEITVGADVLKFKAKAPVSALAALIGDENKVHGMETYVRKALTAGQDETFTALLEQIDIDGLAEILNALGEGYTSVPTTPSAA